jgi:hypothetical protein
MGDYRLTGNKKDENVALRTICEILSRIRKRRR